MALDYTKYLNKSAVATKSRSAQDIVNTVLKKTPQAPNPNNPTGAPSWASPYKLPNGNTAYDTPAKTTIELLSNGNKAVHVTGSNAVPQNAYITDPKNPGKIVNTGHTTYGGDQVQKGMQRDDVTPVGLGGLNSDPLNIRMERLLAGDKGTATDPLEKRLIEEVKSGKTSLGAARAQILATKINQDNPVEQSTWQNFRNVMGTTEPLKQLGKEIANTPPAHTLDMFTKPSPLEQDIEKNFNAQGFLSKAFFRSISPVTGGVGAVAGGIAGKTEDQRIGNNGKIDPTLKANLENMVKKGGPQAEWAKGQLQQFTEAAAPFKEVLPGVTQSDLENMQQGAVAITALFAPFLERGTKMSETNHPLPEAFVNAQELRPKVQSEIKPTASKISESSTEVPTKPESGVPQKTTTSSTQEPTITTPEIKTSKLASGVEQKAVEAGLTQGFEGKPEYAKVNKADQAKAAINLLDTNPEQAHAIAMGHELPPEGILPESVFMAVENRALKNGDVTTLRELATSSSLTSEATGMGQRLSMLAERNPESAISAIRDVVKAREKAASRKVGDIAKGQSKTVLDLKAEIEKHVPKVDEWKSFIDQIKCT